MAPKIFSGLSVCVECNFRHFSPALCPGSLVITSLAVRAYHVLVLKLKCGARYGELLDVVNSHEQHTRLSESTLQRIWRELVSAVEWMQTRFVVHRNIKL
jgi:hypothetical protein